MVLKYSKIPHRVAPTLRNTMLYSQALAGSHASAPQGSSSSASPAGTTTPKPDTGTTTIPRTTRQSNPRNLTNHPTTTPPPPPSSPRPHRHPNNPDHIPNTTTAAAARDQPVYVLTLTTTPSLTDPLTALRRSHFPRRPPGHQGGGHSHLPAHLTLFHALPGSELHAVTSALAELCSAQRGALVLATGAAFRMRRGVGISVADGGGVVGGGGGGKQAARRLHGELQRRWWAFLSPQDRRPWRPHWTVQNKAAGEAAVDAAMEDVRDGFRGAEGLATGCALWRYEEDGGWDFEREFDFGGDK